MGRYSPRAQYRVSHPCRLFWKYVSEVEPGSPHERLHSRDRSAHSNSGSRPGNDNQRDDNYLQTLPGNARLSGRGPRETRTEYKMDGIRPTVEYPEVKLLVSTRQPFRYHTWELQS